MSRRYDDNYQQSTSSEEEECCICITRSFVYWSNVVLLIFGLVALGYSIYLWVSPGNEWAGDSLALKFTIFSAFLIIIALIGIGDTWHTVKPCDLTVYLILIVSIIIAQIAFVIYAAVDSEGLEKYLKEVWDDWSDARKDKVMSSYDCGIYQTSYNVTVDGVNINQGNVSQCVNAAETIDLCFEDCYTVVEDAIKTIGALTSTFLILFALLEIMLMISAFILCCNPDDFDSDSEEPGYEPRKSPKKEGYTRGQNNVHGQASHPPTYNQYAQTRGHNANGHQTYGQQAIHQNRNHVQMVHSRGQYVK